MSFWQNILRIGKREVPKAVEKEPVNTLPGSVVSQEDQPQPISPEAQIAPQEAEKNVTAEPQTTKDETAAPPQAEASNPNPPVQEPAVKEVPQEPTVINTEKITQPDGKPSETPQPAASVDQPAGNPPEAKTQDKDAGKTPAKPRKVFVIESAKEFMNKECLALLKKMGIETIPLNYQERYKKTMEEIIKEHADASFAVVMLSGEDFSYPKDGKPKDARLRAPQASVFALGYLLAKLGRNNTFILYYEQGTFLLPTDFLNAIYTSYNPKGDWIKLLVNRLRLCGFDIDEKIDYQKDFI